MSSKNRRYQATSELSTKRRLVPPWPFSPALGDVWLLFVILPPLWVIGFEQFVPVFLILFALAKRILSHHKLHLPATARIFFIFLGWQLLSATSIDVSSNWYVFAKNFASYLAGFGLYILIVNEVGSVRQFRQTLGFLLLFSAVATGVGLLFVAGLLPDRFSAPGAALVPGALRGSTFVQENIIIREIGRSNAVLAGVKYPRVSSFFLYPTTMAVGYLMLLPMQFYAWRSGRGWRRLWYALLLVASTIVFLFTATRTAFIVLPGAVVVVLVFRWRLWRRLPRLVLPALLALLFFILITALILGGGSLGAFGEQLFVNTRADSFIARLEVYRATLSSLEGHLLIGWGTPRHIPEVRLAPAGTHGEYVNVVYSFGLVGFAIYIALYASIWIDVIRGLKRRTSTATDRFLACVAVVLLAVNVNGLVHGVNFDLLTVLILWSTIGLAHAGARLQTKSGIDWE